MNENRSFTVLPIDCAQLKYIGVYCTLLFIISVPCICSSLVILVKSGSLRTSVNRLHFALQLVNLVGSLCHLPLVTISAFSCQFVFGDLGCTFEAFSMFFVGCFGIYILTAISWERFTIVYSPTVTYVTNLKSTVIIICVCTVLSLIWCSAPLFGWSYYTYEGVGVSCSVGWNERTFGVMSYNVTIFIFVFAIPVLIMLVTNFKVINRIKKSRKLFSESTNDALAKIRCKRERRITIFTIILIAGFLLSWTPYACVALYRAFINDIQMSPLASTIPALFAKTSLIWCALLQLIGNNNMACKQNSEPTRGVEEGQQQQQQKV